MPVTPTYTDAEGEEELSDVPPSSELSSPPQPKRRRTSHQKTSVTEPYPTPKSIPSSSSSNITRGGKEEYKSPSPGIIKRLRVDETFPWKEVSFWVPGWIDKPLQALLCRRITKTGARLAYNLDEAHIILINPHPVFAANYQPYHSLPRVLSGDCLMEPYHWLLKCYYSDRVMDETENLPVFSNKRADALKVGVGELRDEGARVELMVMLEENGAIVVPEKDSEVCVVPPWHPFLRKAPEVSIWQGKAYKSPRWVWDSVNYGTMDEDVHAQQRKMEEVESNKAGPSKLTEVDWEGDYSDLEDETGDEEDEDEEESDTGSERGDEGSVVVDDLASVNPETMSKPRIFISQERRSRLVRNT
ncbi:hypothetical protein M231_04740 [Tremella mesenterica]|uniref:BRCT domain-containing protein n=1 Tax=Tremella mesenterica TaxID=5217 RepID=A0A4Q1BJP8_TREME|nr:hypothetical protein M231_04740 [Tremella mesenterica]